jgi:7-keto-8-aminopelargonate synthetase-like enzyme
MGGDTAPLPAMVELCRAHPNAFVLDDEAHGLGVLGARGRGAAEHLGVLADVDLITITFSKTLGSCGGAVSFSPLTVACPQAICVSFTASVFPIHRGHTLPRPNRAECISCHRSAARQRLRFVGLLTGRSVP